MTGLIVAGVTIVAAVVVGLVVRSRNGRIRTSGDGGTVTSAAPGGRAQDGVAPDGVSADGAALAGLPADVRDALTGEPADVTLVQLSTTFCAPCRQARALLTHVAERTDGLRHVDLDVTDKPGIARDLGVLRTPTTIAYARSGVELLRVSGVPKQEELLAALEPRLSGARRPIAERPEGGRPTE
ncbi:MULTISPECIES: thioredoxin family protein [Prauserella salsuginis group]|uniref:Thioredoxin family protein n=1 Tax=Prauserella salsuginis TaxID=387889 RepID=A0ABW6FZP9_9PSEU|nr:MULTISPECIES: thioredoxin family protein [Prauserella salsuginis group]MCR3721078.1 Thioredoxin [Prauserella flava]MCR3734841.1 Thioredoxin [Prauserella salsuginis]